MVVHMFWETDTKLNENNNAAEQKLCEYWLKICEEKIPPGPYLFVIDAGTLECLENALYLHEKG